MSGSGFGVCQCAPVILLIQFELRVNRPAFSAAEFVAHKALTVPLVSQNVEEGQMVIMNSILTAVVLRNWYLYNTTRSSSYSCRLLILILGSYMYR